MTFEPGYGTNGFADHRLDDALALIADLGHTAVVPTPDHHPDPFAPDLTRRTDRVAARLAALRLRAVETGARHLLDPRREDHPGLVDREWELRAEFLLRAAEMTAALGADCVERLDDASRLGADLGVPEPLGVTLDVGHRVAVERDPPAICLHRVGNLLVDVHLDDMLPGVHEHLQFGHGAVDLPAALVALEKTGYRGITAVQLPWHSHAAPDVARHAMSALLAALPGPVAGHPWPVEAERTVRPDPDTIRAYFPVEGQAVGRTPLRAVPDDAIDLLRSES